MMKAKRISKVPQNAVNENPAQVITVHCVLCGETIKLSREAFDASANFGEYILQSGTMTVIQCGNLCDACAKKDLKDKVIRK